MRDRDDNALIDYSIDHVNYEFHHYYHSSLTDYCMIICFSCMLINHVIYFFVILSFTTE